MRRGVSGEQVRGSLERLRDEVPGIALRTTFIVGFPGETEKDFDELADFVADFEFERMGAFTYSHEEGTRAYELTDLVDPEVAEERRGILMATQRDIHLHRNEQLIGKTMPVLIDGLDEDRETVVGRTTADAPEVDSIVRMAGNSGKAGDLVQAEIVAVDDYELRARVVSQ